MNKCVTNAWHDVDINNQTNNLSTVFNCIIEISKGSKLKYELDKITGLLRLDRVLYSSVHYPANYGFVPQTYCDDEDPLDILVLCTEPIVPLCIVRAKAIGVITMSDDKGKDDKIIAVQANDPSFNHYNNIDELPPHLMIEIHRFFVDYKVLEGKQVVIDGIKGKEEAVKIIQSAVELYKETFINEK